MTVWTRLYDRLDDGLNPILVKELRQAVKSRVVIGILFVFLVFQLMIVTIGITTASDQSLWSGGKRVFLSQQIVLYFTILTALPAYCGARMLSERTDPGGDYMFLNSLNPASIVIGKLFASLAIGFLVFSVCAPFMTLAYLLRGIDLVTIFSVLGLDLVLMMLAMQFALFASALPGGLVLKRLVSGAGFIGLLSFSVSTNRGIWFMVESGTDNWWWIVPTLIPLIAFFGYLFVYNIVLVGTAASNGMILVRLYLVTVILLIWSMLAAALKFWPTGPAARFLPPPEFLPNLFAYPLVFFLGLQLLVATCERDRIGARIAKTVPRWPFLRPLAFLFYSGSAGGILYAVLVIAMTFGLAIALGTFPVSGRPYNPRNLNPLLIFVLYVYLYSLLGYLFRVGLFSRLIKPEQTWILTAVFLGVLSTAPNIFLYLLSSGHVNEANARIWNAANPFYYFFSPALFSDSNASNQTDILYILIVIGLGLSVFTVPLIFRQYAKFLPLSQTASSEAPEQIKHGTLKKTASQGIS